MTNDERMTKHKWSSLTPAHVHNSNRGTEVCHVLHWTDSPWRGEWSALGSRDIDHRTRGARVRERDAIELIRPSVYAVLRRDELADQGSDIGRLRKSGRAANGFSFQGSGVWRSNRKRRLLNAQRSTLNVQWKAGEQAPCPRCSGSTLPRI